MIGDIDKRHAVLRIDQTANHAKAMVIRVNTEGPYTVSLLDIAGRQLWIDRGNGAMSFSIPRTMVQSGVAFVKVVAQNKTTIKKMIAISR